MDHKDRIGKSINVGDIVVYPISNHLNIGKVSKFTPKMIRVMAIETKYRREKIIYSKDALVISGPELTQYFLSK